MRRGSDLVLLMYRRVAVSFTSEKITKVLGLPGSRRRARGEKLVGCPGGPSAYRDATSNDGSRRQIVVPYENGHHDVRLLVWHGQPCHIDVTAL